MCNNKFLDDSGECSMCGQNHLVGQRKRKNVRLANGERFVKPRIERKHDVADFHPMVQEAYQIVITEEERATGMSNTELLLVFEGL